MKKWLAPFLLLMVLAACTNGNTDKEMSAENEVDAARNFIRSSLDGKWNEARKMMVQDSVNLQLLQAAEDNWNHTPIAHKRGYREASINLYDTRRIHDSAVVIAYSNSYRKQKDSLKLLRNNNQWLVDLKFTLLKIDTAGHGQ